MKMTEAMHLNVNELRGTLRKDVDMRRHTSWRAGGHVEQMYQPADLEDLMMFLRQMPVDAPLLALGLGSNLLVRDGGLRGTIVLLHAALSDLRLEEDGTVYAQAGIPGAKLARFAANHNLRGAEFFAGIPGTVGGMLAMNAGCYGGETWNVVRRVQTLNRAGEVRERMPDEYEIGYRHLRRKNSDTESEIFTGAWFGFEQGDGEHSRREIKMLLSQRIATQPLSLPNAGSVFRNPQGDHAARLIEVCGLKGRKIGGAQVSEKHGNFIVNTGDASASDIEKLINEVRAVVLKESGVYLLPEVRIVGEQAEKPGSIDKEKKTT